MPLLFVDQNLNGKIQREFNSGNNLFNLSDPLWDNAFH